MTYEANFAAYTVAAAMLVVVVVTQCAASGKIRRNGFVGLRIPPTMASDAAWVAGHRAAVAPSWIGFVVVAITAGAAQFTPGANRLIALCSEAGLLSSNYEGSLLRSVEYSAHD